MQQQQQSALDNVEPHDIMKYGMIPEFVGRLPVLVNVNQLTEKDLVRVLTEPKNALVKQYEELFNLYKVQVLFSLSLETRKLAHPRYIHISFRQR